jgi:hypothetical protein
MGVLLPPPKALPMALPMLPTTPRMLLTTLLASLTMLLKMLDTSATML